MTEGESTALQALNLTRKTASEIGAAADCLLIA